METKFIATLQSLQSAFLHSRTGSLSFKRVNSSQEVVDQRQQTGTARDCVG